MTWVAGLGQPVAGDDGVGLRVLALLAQGDLPSDLSLHPLSDATGLLPLMATGEPGVVVDAVLDAPGRVRLVPEDELAELPGVGLSSHGVSVLQALRLARAIYPAVSDVRVVAVGIEAPVAPRPGLSPTVEAAAVEAAALVRALAQAGGITTCRL